MSSTLAVAGVATVTFARLRAESSANLFPSSTITSTLESMLRAERTFANSTVLELQMKELQLLQIYLLQL